MCRFNTGNSSRISFIFIFFYFLESRKGKTASWKWRLLPEMSFSLNYAFKRDLGLPLKSTLSSYILRCQLLPLLLNPDMRNLLCWSSFVLSSIFNLCIYTVYICIYFKNIYSKESTCNVFTWIKTTNSKSSKTSPCYRPSLHAACQLQGIQATLTKGRMLRKLYICQSMK